MDIIQKFSKSSYPKKAEQLMKNPAKVLLLVGQLKKYLHRGGLASVKEDLLLLAGYVKDVFTSKYKDYSKGKMLLCVAAIVYVVTPLDFLPDFIMFAGLVDDVAVVGWLVNHLHDELVHYKAWKEKNAQNRPEEIEDREKCKV